MELLNRETKNKVWIVPDSPISHIKLGDPDYFNDDIGKEYTLEYNKLPSDNRISGMYIESVREKWEYDEEERQLYGKDSTEIDSTNIVVYSFDKGSNETLNLINNKNNPADRVYAVIDTLEKYGNKKNVETTLLGCDTAQFVFEVNNKDELVSTLADGAYGSAVYTKESESFAAVLLLDETALSFKEAVQLADYLMDIPEKKKELYHFERMPVLDTDMSREEQLAVREAARNEKADKTFEQNER